MNEPSAEQFAVKTDTPPPRKASLRKWQIVRLDPKRPLLLAGPVAVFVGVLIGVLNGWAFPDSPGRSALFGLIAALAVLLSVLLGVGLFNLICDRMNKGLTVWVRDPAGLSDTLPAAAATIPAPPSPPEKAPPDPDETTTPPPPAAEEEPYWFEQPYPDPDEELAQPEPSEDDEPSEEDIKHWSQQPFPDPDTEDRSPHDPPRQPAGEQAR